MQKTSSLDSKYTWRWVNRYFLNLLECLNQQSVNQSIISQEITIASIFEKEVELICIIPSKSLTIPSASHQLKSTIKIQFVIIKLEILTESLKQLIQLTTPRVSHLISTPQQLWTIGLSSVPPRAPTRSLHLGSSKKPSCQRTHLHQQTQHHLTTSTI